MTNLIHKFFLWILPKIAKYHPSNKREDRLKYPQIWWLMPKRWKESKTKFYPNGHRKLIRRKLRIIIEYICGFLTGHELSKTEWGYGCGSYIDRNCRWCDKFFQIPKIEEPTKYKQFKDLFNE